MWYNRALFNHYYPILNGVGAVIAVFELSAAVYLHIVTYVGVFVDNGIFNIASVAYTHNGGIGSLRCLYFFQRLVIIATHYIAILDSSAYTNAGTYADN